MSAHVTGGRRIGIFGGTFDPIHEGHLALASGVADELGFSELRFMPAGRPNFKRDRDVTPAEQRIRMVELAIACDERFVLDRREVDRAGVTYTVDTLEELHAEDPDARLFFIIGADSAETLVHWRGAERLSQLATFVVASRPGVSKDQVISAHAQSPFQFDLVFANTPLLDVSSTEIRERISCGRSVAGMLPSAVIAYIEQQGLYR